MTKALNEKNFPYLLQDTVTGSMRETIQTSERSPTETKTIPYLHAIARDSGATAICVGAYTADVFAIKRSVLVFGAIISSTTSIAAICSVLALLEQLS